MFKLWTGVNGAAIVSVLFAVPCRRDEMRAGPDPGSEVVMWPIRLWLLSDNTVEINYIIFS